MLRHQQKLHQAGPPSARARARRDSTTVNQQTGARARKNSLASNAGPNVVPPHSMRPRANTISHIDNASFQMMMGSQPRMTGVHIGHQHSISEMPDFSGYDMRTAGFGQVSGISHLPRIETSGLGVNIDGGMRTAPVGSFDFDKLFAGPTVNPAQLHSFEAQHTPESPFSQHFSHHTGDGGFETIDWTSAHHMQDHMMDSMNEGLMDGSSPSAISTGSLSGFSDMMVDGTGHPSHSSAMWTNPLVVSTTQFHNDPITAAHFPELIQAGSPVTMEPHELHDNKGNGANLLSLNAVSLTSMSSLSGPSSNAIHSSIVPSIMSFDSDTTSSAASSFTDAGRQALLFMLSQTGSFGLATNNYAQSSITPMSPGFSQPPPPVSLPSTGELQRYINSYVKYFHPHAPFLHVPTLDLNSPTFTSGLQRSSRYAGGIVGGGGCLTLAMAAIGAGYEFDHAVALELFEASKKLFNYYLEARRKAQSTYHVAQGASQQATPLWLVQAMLLNLIFGHQCGDHKAIEIASTHCAALISLARSAGLLNVPSSGVIDEDVQHLLASRNLDNEMEPVEKDSYIKWLRWKFVEERKRTLYSVFVLSSFLVIGYNQAPKILNSELQLDLPCEEDLWAASNPTEWNGLGGIGAAQQNVMSCKLALEYLLKSSQRRPTHQRSFSLHQPMASSTTKSHRQQSQLRPSTFGCYILINALHVYIWETRQRHQGREWKPQETERLFTYLEPALREWQAAWWSNPRHHLKRPSPHGPLPADCIPLLDLAYIRLFVNLSRSKETSWLRDVEGMPTSTQSTNEQNQQLDLIAQQHLQPLSLEDPTSSHDIKPIDNTMSFETSAGDLQALLENQPSPHERLLRKAGFYAADSLVMADKLGATYAHFTSRELPQQVAMCTFDSAQVLAEWIATVQARVGSLDMAGAELENEDYRLLAKIGEILDSFWNKMGVEAQTRGVSVEEMIGASNGGGMGHRLLMATAWLLDKAAVWGSKLFVLVTVMGMLTFL